MRLSRCLILLAMLLASARPGAAQQDAEPSRKVMETMSRHASSLRAVVRPADGKELPLKLVAKPILRYSDPGGITTDASIWAWASKGRPEILAGIFFLNQEASDPKWSCELLSLTDQAVTVRSQVGWNWTPPKADLKWLSIAGAPGDSERQRLRQMKEIAERYEVTTSEGTQKMQLRLMIQPLYRYADGERGLVDGAIFSYAAGTNPETLLILECRKTFDASDWHAAFVRFGANICQARQDDEVVWECPAVKSWSPKEPYFSQFGPVEKVFGADGE
jgi:hypothetical protein